MTIFPFLSLHKLLIHFLYFFFLTYRQVAEQLADNVHVTRTVITKGTFDVATQLCTAQVDLSRCCAGWPVACPGGCPRHLLGKEHQGQLRVPTHVTSCPAWQVCTSFKKTGRYQTLLQNMVSLTKLLCHLNTHHVQGVPVQNEHPQISCR